MQAPGRFRAEVRRGRRPAGRSWPTASTRSSSSTPRRRTSRPWPARPDRVKAFTDGGGWLMAWGLTPEGLADFNRLVGVEHVLRPFELERVTLPALRDPLLSA